MVGLGSLAVLAVVVLAAVPTASAAPPKAIVKLSAPFTGATAYDHAPHAKTGCGGSVLVGTAPNFNLSSGVSTFSISATETACSAGSASSATQYVKSGLSGLTFAVPASGVYNLTAHWVLNGTFTYGLSAANNASSFSASYRTAEVFCLSANTTNTTTCHTVTAKVVTFSGTNASGTVTVAYSIVQVFRNAALQSGVTYSIEAYLYAHVTAASTAGSTGGSATAGLSFAGGGAAATLGPIKVFP